MQHRPLFAQSDIDKALQRELSIDNQDAKRKILSNSEKNPALHELRKVLNLDVDY